METVTVIKLNLARQETWRYAGQVLQRSPSAALIRAEFNRDDFPFNGILLRRGDPFIEAYFSDRWYNIFEIHDRDDGRVKGWYCNVAEPAEMQGGQIRYVDLALDLLVYPDGRQLVLDEDEFAMLELSAEFHLQARRALDELKLLLAEPGFEMSRLVK